MPPYNLLIIDDNESFLASAKSALKNFTTYTAPSVHSAKEIVSDIIDLVLLDLVFDDRQPEVLQGLELLEFIRTRYPELPVIIMTNYTSTDITVRAIKSGAIDFLNKKELNWNEWSIRIKNYCASSSEIKKLRTIEKELEEKYESTDIVGVSDEIEFIKRRLKDLAQNSKEASIFIYGETGTGKNLAVRYFRKNSKRAEKAYREFSISELSDTVLESELFGHVKGAFTGAMYDKKGLFEEVDGGILFLDEIGDCDLRSQIKIMRFIEDKTITPVGSTKSKSLDLQLILATNKDLTQLVSEGKFREDLYHRINRIKIEIPPLRQRRDDIRILTDHFFHHFRVREKTNLISISDEVYELFNRYDWPGNVRELQSIIWDACTKARLYGENILFPKHIRPEVLVKNKQGPVEIGQNDSLEIKKARIELEEIDRALEQTYGQKRKAAELLKMKPDDLRYRVFKYSKMFPDLIGNFEYIQKFYLKASR